MCSLLNDVLVNIVSEDSDDLNQIIETPFLGYEPKVNVSYCHYFSFAPCPFALTKKIKQTLVEWSLI